jgi:hypothetical protein
MGQIRRHDQGFLEQHSLEEMVNKCVKKKDTIMDYSI